MYVGNVGKPSSNVMIVTVTSELTLERNHTCVFSVGKLSPFPNPFKYMKKITLEKNPIYVSSVGKPLPVPRTFSDMKELTVKNSVSNISTGVNRGNV